MNQQRNDIQSPCQFFLWPSRIVCTGPESIEERAFVLVKSQHMVNLCNLGEKFFSCQREHLNDGLNLKAS
jgi:hypothetical protein